MANPTVLVEFLADTKQLSAGVKQAQGGMKSVGRTALRAAGAAGVGALIAAVKIGADEFSEAAKVSAQTESVLKSTGGAAGVTAKQVSDLAGSLMEKSGVDDEAIQSGENLLLTFTNIRNEAGKGNDVFNQATGIMLDMSVALGQDMKSSAVQLGKALNDPIKGVTALQRVGVSFTKAQKEQIKALVDSGRTMDAQKLILAELNKEFGGSAEAAGKTLPGQLNVAKESFSNLAGEIAGTVMPSILKFVKIMNEHPQLMKAVTIAVLALAAAMVVLNVALAVSAVVASPIALLFIGIAAAVVGLIAVAVLLWKNWDTMTAQLKKGFNTIKAAAEDVFDWLKKNWPLILGILTGPFGLAVVAIAKNWDTIENAARAAVQTIKNVLGTISGFIDSIVSAIRGALTRAAAPFDVIANAAQAAVAAVKAAVGGIAGAVESAVGAVKSAASAVANAIKAPINAVLSAWNSISFTIPRINLPSVKIAGKKIGGGSFGGQSFGVPNIPLLAQGGIVTRPTLAMIGEAGPEAVLPLSGSSGGAPVEVRVFIGDQELRGLVRTEVVDVNTGIARTLLAGRA